MISGGAGFGTRAKGAAVSEIVGLFENDRQANVESLVSMIEDVLVELGHFLNECRVEEDSSLKAWSVVKGSASIRINLIDKSDFVHLRLESPVIYTDESVDKTALYAKLLTLNAEALSGAAFGIQGNAVVLITQRSTLDLDRSEVLEMVTLIQNYADQYDDKLAAEFGGSLDGG